jgi:MFS family permease
MLIITALDCIASAAHNIGFPILADHLKSGQSAYVFGLIMATWGLGTIIGAFIFRYIISKITNETIRNKVFFIGVLVMSGGFIIGFYQNLIIISLAFIFIAGVGDGITNLAFVSKVQSAQENLRMSLFSSMSFMQNSGFALGLIMVAPFFHILAFANVVLVFHFIPILAVLIYLFQRVKLNEK